MIWVALAEAAVIAVLIFAGYRERRVHDKAILDLMVQTGLERAALIDKIQHPEIIPRAVAAPVDNETRDRLLERHREHMAALGQVGTVRRDAPNGNPE